MARMEELGGGAPTPYPSFIAMKGHPFTRKTEFADTIATSLGCPILSMEHFLRFLKPPLSPEREFETFVGICGIAHHQLDRGISDVVVIDSPLSSKSHLNHLTNMAFDLMRIGIRVIIVECKAKSLYSWKMKLEEHLAHRPIYKPAEWFKPKNWEDVEKAIKDNPDYDETSLLHHVFVSKLVVDPLLDVPVESTYHIHTKPPITPRLVEAVKYMMTRVQGDGPNVVVYRQWLQQTQHHTSSSIVLGEKYCTRHGHDIFPSSNTVERSKHEAVSCMACKKQIRRSNNDVDAYCYCKNCNLALHKECIEAVDRNGKNRSFRKKFACNPCREIGNDFSNECESCLFQTRLKCQLPPTIFKHFDTEEHFLTVMPQYEAELNQCVACGYSDREKIYLCKDSGFAYHYECVILPRRVKDVHGGHNHTLSLKFTSEEAEDYLCHECLELRDPTHWFYSCQDCSSYDLHPHCVNALKQSNRKV